MDSIGEPVATSATGAQPADFLVVPEVTLPCGVTVPGFAVARNLASRGRHGRVVVAAGAAPWVNISYHGARHVCAGAGWALMTELQALAIAFDVAWQGINWTGGAVGAGHLFQGLHKGTFDGAQPACVESPDPEERRWLELSTGERIYDFAGNAFSWVYDDVQGNEQGVVVRTFAAGSPTIATAPGEPMQRGLGWWPRAGSDWWGRALARGGCWSSQSGAGVFLVVDERPRTERNYIGFRPTLPSAQSTFSGHQPCSPSAR